MEKIKTLIVDDSSVVQRMISEILSQDEQIEVLPAAKNGRDGLDKIEECLPHVVILDMEMPLMDGMEMLRRLRKTHPVFPAVIFFSHLSEKGAKITMDALALGAQDFLTKPAAYGSYNEVISEMRKGLVSKVKQFGNRALNREKKSGEIREKIQKKKKEQKTFGKSPNSKSTISIAACGASTGGTEALTEVLSGIPMEIPVPIVVVHHMPPIYTEYYAKRLNDEVNIKVVEASHGQKLRAGIAYIAPGGSHMELEKQGDETVVIIRKGEAVHNCQPSIDVLFQSVSKIYGAEALGVILCGSSEDGVDGCKAISEKMGHIIAQDEATSLLWGTPKKIVEAGYSDEVIPIGDIAGAIQQQSTK